MVKKLLVLCKDLVIQREGLRDQSEHSAQITPSKRNTFRKKGGTLKRPFIDTCIFSES